MNMCHPNMSRRAGLTIAQLALLFAFIVVSPALSAPNPVSNGGFEQLGPNGRPVDWEFVGETVTVTDEAHTGRYALRFVRDEESPAETGLNRTWTPLSGEAGEMLTQRKGGLSYWYRAIRGDARFLFQAIPMSDKPIEDTGSPRVTWSVPRAHIGDGEWHEARFAYDFTDNPKVRFVHVAVRLIGGSGKLLVDDIRWLERVGPVVGLGEANLWLDSPELPDQAILRVKVENLGDAPLGEVSLDVNLPEGLAAEPRESLASDLPAGEPTFVSWWIHGTRRGEDTIQIQAEAGEASASTSLTYRPELAIESLLANPFIVAPEDTARITATVVNRGKSTSAPTSLRLLGHDGEVISPEQQTVPAIRPSGETTVSWKVWLADAGEARFRCVGEGFDPVESQMLVTPAASTEVVPEHLAGSLWLRSHGEAALGEIRRPDEPLVALFPHMGRVGFRNEMGDTEWVTLWGGAKTWYTDRDQGSTSLQWRDSDGGQWMCSLDVEGVSDELTKLRWQLTCDKPRDLLAFDGPMLYVPGEHVEALFPGLEWLVEGEVSSNARDIARDHPDRVRYAPHPNKVTVPLMAVRNDQGVTALLWDMKQRWDGAHDRPQPVFAVPDRFAGRDASLMGLMVPSVASGLPENARVMDEPYPLEPGRTLRLEAHVFHDPDSTDVLDALDAWFAVYDPMPVLEWPQSDPREQIEFSMQGYMSSLWVSPEEGWLPFLGGPALGREPAHRPDFAYDLLMGSALAPERDPAWRERADEQLRRANAYPISEDFGFGYRDPLYAVMERLAIAERHLGSMHADNSWRFDADRIDRGVFEGQDYHKLGPDAATELGTLARRCYETLLHARLTGDMEAYRRLVPTLERMGRFEVPRAAQVWEVPVHTPDILAAADAVDAFVEAYGISGESRWLEQAQRWAKAGLPFIYVWDAGHPERPWMRYGSIPVFGATWYQGSWFGRVVQWNGLRYAYALIKLHTFDPDGIGGVPWLEFARGITVSAAYQQSTEGENLALWPDAYGTIDGVRANWEFAPKQILKNLGGFIGWAAEPATVLISEGQMVEAKEFITRSEASDAHRAAISALNLAKARWEGGELRVDIHEARRVGPPGYLLVSGVTEPDRVLAISGAPFDDSEHTRRVPPFNGPLSRPEVWHQREIAWSYDAGYAVLRVELPGSASALRCEGVRPASTSYLAIPVESLAFEFDRGTEGWRPANDVADFRTEEGALKMRVTGGDPYLTRTQLRVSAEGTQVIRLRVGRSQPGGSWQCFFVTQESPRWEEAKSVRFPGPRTTDWETLTIPISENARWRGTITGFRLDPPGTLGAQIAIDWIRPPAPMGRK